MLKEMQKQYDLERDMQQINTDRRRLHNDVSIPNYQSFDNKYNLHERKETPLYGGNNYARAFDKENKYGAPTPPPGGHGYSREKRYE